MSESKSNVWKFFRKTPSSKMVVCDLCKKQFKYCNNTTNMREHLRRKHPDTMVTILQSANETNTGEDRGPATEEVCVRDPLIYDDNSSKKKHLDKIFTRMVAVDMEPLRMSEHVGLIEFVHALDPKYKMPTRTTLTRKLLPDLQNQYRVKLYQLLTKVKNLAITFDMWTSVSNLGIGALTAHFIHDDVLTSALLCTKHVEGHHDADNLTAAVKEALEEWHIDKKVVAMVTDHAPVMVKVADNLKYRHVGCFAHALNTVLRHAACDSELTDLVAKSKRIVTFIHHSQLASDKLKAELKRHDKKELALIQATETRWNSTFEMLKRIRELRDELSIVLSQCSRAPENLSAEEYKLIEEIEPILEPFETCTEAASGEDYVTISLIIPLVKGVSLRLCELEKENLSDTAKKFLSKVKQCVIQTLKPYETRTPCIIGTLLNPHFKKLGFKTESDVERAIAYVQREYSNYLASVRIESPSTSTACDTSEPEPSSSKKSKLSSLLKFLDSSPPIVHHTSDAIIDIRQYIEKPVIPPSEDPVKYWSMTYNQLKEVALKYLCIPGTSTPAERIFSAAGQVVTDRRNRLNPDHIDALLFIRHNYKLFEDM